jgi:SAM-dependent methyltransferase
VQTPDYYSAAPELGLDGRWAPELRMSGLDVLVSECTGKSVLDLGAAEGLIARRFLQGGAALVHGFDIVPERVTAARRICAGFAEAAFWQADLSDWDRFIESHAPHLLERYDIVLYLGIHHHLPPATRSSAFEGAAAKCADTLALRTPEVSYRDEHLSERLARNGFQLIGERVDPAAELGPLRIFRRRDDRTGA